MEAENILKDCKVKVWPGTYSVVKAKYVPQHYIAAIRDFNETTVITEPHNIPADCAITEESGWKILTFELVLPFEFIGFLSLITRQLAAAKISVFALSSFSTDHILVKSERFEEAIQVLKTLGCSIDM